MGRPVTRTIHRDAEHPSRLVLPFTTQAAGRGRARPHFTTSVPCIDGWMLQWNGYDPGVVGAVKVLVPSDAWSSNAPPVSAVTVWAVPSWLSTVTVAPGLTEAGVEKAKPLIVIVEAALTASDEDEPADDELEVAPEDDGEPDEPQPTRVTAHRPARTSRAPE